MMSENNQTTSLRPSPSNAFGASAEAGGGTSGESRRNRNARAWNALLSMSAIGVFLEGCGANLNGEDANASPLAQLGLTPQGFVPVGFVPVGLVPVGTLNIGTGTDGNNFFDVVDDFFDVVDDFFDFFDVDDNPPDRSSDDDTPETPETPSYVDPDSYIVRSGETVTIDFDSDGGSLLYRDVTNDELVTFTLYPGDDVAISIGTAEAFITSSPALRKGFYTLHLEENDDFSGYLYLGTSSPDILTADARGTGRLVGFAGDDVLTGSFTFDALSGGKGNDKLYGAGKDDILAGGDGDDLLQGGIGNDELRGEGGSDTYIFDAGDGNDLIRGNGDETGNTLVFRTLPTDTYTYADTDFQFNRGFLQGAETLGNSESGSDLEIVVSAQGVEKNRVIIQDYFSAEDDAYTIYRNALSEDTIVSTSPAETS